jgi:glucosamine-6-phosphate deaminase
MNIQIYDNGNELGHAAAKLAAKTLHDAIAKNGKARFIAATGASQFDFLKALVARGDVDWSRTEMFHLDEYIGIPATHPASFRKYLLERLIEPAGIESYHLLNADEDPNRVCAETGALLNAAPIDVAFVGIGENGHLAFNDPPANFDTEEPYIVVELDEACRKQQMGEGWFKTMNDVPSHAISMSIHQMLQAKKIICVVPDARKAQAVADCLAGKISPKHPASVLQKHPDVTVFLDHASSSKLRR